MSATPEAPCDWPYLACPCEALDSLGGSPGEPVTQDVIDMAAFMLWAATGRVFGPCPVSVLPCGDPWILCGSCHGSYRACGCRSISEIRLDGPVSEVTAVVIDGVTLDATDYRIEDYEWLVRLDGGTWPTNPDPLDPDAFRVDYTLGIAPPAGAGITTGILACELAKDICNDDSCRLPRRVRSLTRQGLTVEWESGQGFGLPDVDSWVNAALHPILAGAVHSPDFPNIRRITWTAPTSP